jgi:hypothetical protein
MAPELFRGEACSLESDVYAFAVTLWELFSSDTPFAGCSSVAEIKDKAGPRPQPPPPPSAAQRSTHRTARAPWIWAPETHVLLPWPDLCPHRLRCRWGCVRGAGAWGCAAACAAMSAWRTLGYGW